MNWQDESEYQYTDQHYFIDWGWEFLRRNPEYIKCWKEKVKEARKNPYVKDASYTPFPSGTQDVNNLESFVIRCTPEEYKKWGIPFIQNPELKSLKHFNAGVDEENFDVFICRGSRQYQTLTFE